MKIVPDGKTCCIPGCVKRLAPGSKRSCVKHLLAQRLSNRKQRGYSKWKPGKRGRPPLIREDV